MKMSEMDDPETVWRDDDLPTISEALFEVLDMIGLSEEIRETRIEKTAIGDIVHATVGAVIDRGIAQLAMGSQSEATSTEEMNSDSDFLFYYPYIRAYETIREDPVHLLMCRDTVTPPGYVKLRWVVNGKVVDNMEDIPEEFSNHCTHDTSGNLVMLNTKVAIKELKADVRHGPAQTSLPKDGYNEQDYVHAYFCPEWPSFVEEWFYRVGQFDVAELALFEMYGCFVVPVGHPYSAERDMEWRLSFSLQERYMMHNLNPVQYKCYVLLKFIKKYLIKPKVGEVISSYHCKTALFYVKETEVDDDLAPEQLLQTAILCLKLLLKWVERKEAPNFFIPEENMIAHKLPDDTQCILIDCLKELIETNCVDLLTVECDKLSDLLKTLLYLPDVGKVEIIAKQSNRESNFLKLLAGKDVLQNLAAERNKFLYSMKSVTVDKNIVMLRQFLEYTKIVQEIANIHPIQDTFLLLSVFGRIVYEHVDGKQKSLFPKGFESLFSIDDNENTALATEFTFSQLEQAMDLLTSVINTLLATHLAVSLKNDVGKRLSTAMDTDNDDLVEEEATTTSYASFDDVPDKACGDKQLLSQLKRMEEMEKCFENGTFTDGISSQLKYATALHALERHGQCLDILTTLQYEVENMYIHPVCACQGGESVMRNALLDILPETTSMLDIMNKCLLGCIVFGESERNIIPSPLVFEMFRSFGVQRESTDEVNFDSWFEFAAVDGKVYLYFLKYHVHRQIQAQGKMNQSLYKLEDVIVENYNLSHTETALNLLGSVFVDKGWLSLATVCFRRSLQIRPLNNAARWHLMFLLFSNKNMPNNLLTLRTSIGLDGGLEFNL